jgi:hypothetical protein
MAGNERSLQITDAYRDHLLRLRATAGAIAVRDWAATVAVSDLDSTHPEWIARTAATLATIQTASVRLTNAYLTAFLRSELGQPATAGPMLDSARYVGVSRTGKTLAEALVPTVITVKKAIGAGTDPAAAMQQGSAQAERLAVTETMDTARTALGDGIREEPRIVGWHRVTAGGCGACLAAATRTYSAHEPLRVHDGCRCGAEPVVADVPDRAPRPNGHQIFDRMTPGEQDTALGGPAAELVRTGQVALSDLIATSPMAAIPDQITQAPLEALQAQAA